MIAGWVFDLAMWWGRFVPASERLLLVTAGESLRPPTAPEPTAAEEASWTEVMQVLRTAGGAQRRLTREVLAAAHPWLDLRELREPGEDLAATLNDAAELLARMHTQDDPVVRDEEPMALNAVLGPRRRRGVTLAQLRRAAERGDAEKFVADMARRADQSPSGAAHSSDVEQQRHVEQQRDVEQQWSVRWDTDGLFQAMRHEELVVGWSAHPAGVGEVLAAIVPTPKMRWAGGEPANPYQLSEAQHPGLGLEDRCRLFRADPDALGAVCERVATLRQNWPVPDIAARVAAAASQLNRDEPQLSYRVGRLEHGSGWGWAETARWVDTRTIVAAVDKIWGEFDRSEPERRARWVPARARELLAVPPDELPGFLRTHFAEGGDDPGPVDLQQYQGPEGPLHLVGSGGAHRTHLSRILGLPAMFATVRAMPTPREATTSDAADDEPDIAEALAPLWRGLLARRLIRAQVLHDDPWTMRLRLDHVPALWWLLPADRAAAYNRRYELLYPGALARLGVPAGAVETSAGWRDWLTTVE